MRTVRVVGVTAMWWEYVIILSGLVLAVAYVFWTLLRSFRAKGNCCASSCSHTPANGEGHDQRLRVTPLVELRSTNRVSGADEPDQPHA